MRCFKRAQRKAPTPAGTSICSYLSGETYDSKGKSRFSSQWPHALNRFLPSAPNGNYSATSLQSVRDELFINIFDEMVYESGAVGKAAKSSSAFVRQHEFSLLLALLRVTGREGSPCTPG